MSKYIIFIIIQLMLISSTYAGKTVRVEGYGKTQHEAVQSCLKDAVGQVAGLYLISETQLKNSILIKDEIKTKTSGFIKSFKIRNCKSEDGEYYCQVDVTVETRKKKIIKYLKKLMGNKTCSVNIHEWIGQSENHNRIFQPQVINGLIQKGFYVVTPAIDPTYTIDGTIRIRKALSQLNTATFTTTKLQSLEITARDRTNILGIFHLSEKDKCTETGNDLYHAGLNSLNCLVNNVINNVNRKLIGKMKGK